MIPTISIIVLLDVFGFIGGVIGAILVGRVDRRGFIFFIIGSSAHGLMGGLQGNWGLLATCITFIVIDAYYFRKWKPKGAAT